MEFNKYFDHTFLKAFATKQDIDTLCQQAKELNTASVCVNEDWVAYCKNLLKDTDVMVCSVVGFPLGQCGLNTKAYETKEALKGRMTDLANDIVEKMIGYRSEVQGFDNDTVNRILYQ